MKPAIKGPGISRVELLEHCDFLEEQVGLSAHVAPLEVSQLMMRFPKETLPPHCHVIGPYSITVAFPPAGMVSASHWHID